MVAGSPLHYLTLCLMLALCYACFASLLRLIKVTATWGREAAIIGKLMMFRRRDQVLSIFQ
jgi:hypothetical protein